MAINGLWPPEGACVRGYLLIHLSPPRVRRVRRARTGEEVEAGKEGEESEGGEGGEDGYEGGEEGEEGEGAGEDKDEEAPLPVDRIDNVCGLLSSTQTAVLLASAGRWRRRQS